MRFDREPCPQAVSSCPITTQSRWSYKMKNKNYLYKKHRVSYQLDCTNRLTHSEGACSQTLPPDAVVSPLSTDGQSSSRSHQLRLTTYSTGSSRYKNKTVHIQFRQLCGHLSNDDQVDGAGERLQEGNSVSVIDVNEAVSVCLQSGC